jgi:hypothetical protein
MSVFPLPFEDLAALTVISEGRVLASGYEGRGARFALLDVATGRWEGPVSYPDWLMLREVTRVSRGEVLLLGSSAVILAVDPLRVETLSPSREKWPGTPVALRPEGALVAGGFHGPGLPRKEVETYRARHWTTVAPLPGPRWSGMGVQALCGRVVLGGRAPTAEEQFSVDVYDAERDLWERVRPSWAAPVLKESSIAKMREISARHGHVSEPRPTTAMWTSPVAMADGSVVMFVDAAGEFSTSLSTMAWLDPVGLSWSEAVVVPEGVAQVRRAVVGLADGRLVTTGWSKVAKQERLFTWSITEGWREGPEMVADLHTPLAVMADGRVLCVSEGALRPVAL